MEMEKVDILLPPTFEKSGVVKTRAQADEDGDWIAGFNLWIVQRVPVPAIVYQRRSLNSKWEPGKLDVSAGGHLQAGEEPLEGIREAREELGRDYPAEALYSVGRRLNISPNTRGVMLHRLCHLFLVEDNTPIEQYTLDEREVSAVCVCPIADVIRAYQEPGYAFDVDGLDAKRAPIHLRVDAQSFPYNWDQYLYKMALIAERFLSGERPILY